VVECSNTNLSESRGDVPVFLNTFTDIQIRKVIFEKNDIAQQIITYINEYLVDLKFKTEEKVIFYYHSSDVERNIFIFDRVQGRFFVVDNPFRNHIFKNIIPKGKKEKRKLIETCLKKEKYKQLFKQCTQKVFDDISVDSITIVDLVSVITGHTLRKWLEQNGFYSEYSFSKTSDFWYKKLINNQGVDPRLSLWNSNIGLMLGVLKGYE